MKKIRKQTEQQPRPKIVGRIKLPHNKAYVDDIVNLRETLLVDHAKFMAMRSNMSDYLHKTIKDDATRNNFKHDSQKANKFFANKFYFKSVDGMDLVWKYMPDKKKGRGNHFVMLAMASYKTKGGTIYAALDYAIREEKVINIYTSHFFDRIMERMNMSDRKSAYRWFVSGELSRTGNNIYVRDMPPTSVFRAIDGGICLGEYIDEERNAILFKTFVSDELLNNDQRISATIMKEMETLKEGAGNFALAIQNLKDRGAFAAFDDSAALLDLVDDDLKEDGTKENENDEA